MGDGNKQRRGLLLKQTSLANYFLDLYLNDWPSLPRNDEQCNIEVVTFETRAAVEQYRRHYLVYGYPCFYSITPQLHNYVYIRNQLKWFL